MKSTHISAGALSPYRFLGSLPNDINGTEGRGRRKENGVTVYYDFLKRRLSRDRNDRNLFRCKRGRKVRLRDKCFLPLLNFKLTGQRSDGPSSSPESRTRRRLLRSRRVVQYYRGIIKLSGSKMEREKLRLERRRFFLPLAYITHYRTRRNYDPSRRPRREFRGQSRHSCFRRG